MNMNAESLWLHAIFMLHIKQQRDILDEVQNILSYLPLLLKNVLRAKKLLQFFFNVNISAQFMSLICMYKNNVNFVFVATK